MADDISTRKEVCSEEKRFSHADGVLSSCVGYDCGEAKWLILRSPDGKRFRDGATCRLVREADKKLAGEPVIRHWGVMWDHHWWRVDFTVADEPGTYRMEIPLAAGGTVAGDPIEVAAHCLFDETWRATSIDLLPKRHHRDGGWFDCGNGGSCDRNAHPFMVTGLLDLLERHPTMAVEDRKVLVNEMERGLTCLIAAQTPTGWWKSDTRSRPECALAFALASRLLAKERPELAAECRARALRLIPCALVPGIDWREAKRRRDRIDAGKELAARGYPGTYYLLTVAAARVELLRAGDEGQLPHIVDLLRRLTGRQIPADKPEGKYWGHFLAEDGGQASVMVGMTDHGAWRPYWIVPFIDMCRLRPKHPDASSWRRVVEDFTKGYLLPACRANPFLLIPNGYYRQADPPGLRWFANRWHGHNMAFAYTAALALELDGFLHEPELRRIAMANLQWIAGLNVGLPRAAEDRQKEQVFGTSMVFGVGRRYVGGWLGDRGMISNGFKCGQEFKTPDLDAGDWPDYSLWVGFLDGKERAFLPGKTPEGNPHAKGAEEWIVHVGAWLSAVSRLRQSQDAPSPAVKPAQGGATAAPPADASAGETGTHVMGAIRSSPVNGGVLHEYDFSWKHRPFNKRQAQNMAVWIPDGVKILRGVMVYTNTGSDAHRTELQEFVRSIDFALAGTLIRYREMGRVLAEQLAWVGGKTGHRELAHAPWVLQGFSRMEAAALNFVAMRYPQRTLCLTVGGGPGTALDLSNDGPAEGEAEDGLPPLPYAQRLAIAARIPFMKVAASRDPVLHGPAVETGHLANHANWMRDCYRKLRALDLPWSVALEWDVAHTTRNNGAVYWPFIQAVLKARYPKDADPASGPVALKPLSVKDGLLVDAGNWLDHYGEPRPYARYDGPAETAVWLPDMNTYTAWRSLCSRDTPAKIEARVNPGGMLTLALAGAPAGADRIEWYAYTESLGTGAEITTGALRGKDARTVYSVIAAGGEKLWTQPIQVMGGKVVDQAAGMALAAEHEAR